MAKQKVRKYELTYLVQPEISDEDRAKLNERIDQVFEEFGATLLRREDWGKRKLAYEIRKFTKAYFVYMVFVGKPGLTQELERVMRMNDHIVRFLTIKLEEGLDPDNIVYEEEPRRPAARVILDDDDDDDDIDDDDADEEFPDA